MAVLKKPLIGEVGINGTVPFIHMVLNVCDFQRNIAENFLRRSVMTTLETIKRVADALDMRLEIKLHHNKA